jgi:hypothetical protein
MAACALGLSLVAVVGPLSGVSGATTGGPDFSGYRYTDSAEPGGPSAGFASIATTGTDVGNHCDDCVTPIALPFGLRLYGHYQNAWVSDNGMMGFGTATDDFPRAVIPDPRVHDALMPFFADLVTDTPGSGIFMQTTGTPPHRDVTIEWDATTYSLVGIPVSFQVVLHEGQSTFEYRYGHISPGLTDQSVAVGMQGAGGSNGNALLYSGNVTSLTDNLAVRFANDSLNTFVDLSTTTPADYTAGDTVTIQALVQLFDQSTTPTGTVTFSYYGGPLGTVTVAPYTPIAGGPAVPVGIATLTTTALPAGEIPTVLAVYSGDPASSRSMNTIDVDLFRHSTVTALLAPTGTTLPYGVPVVASVKSGITYSAPLDGTVRFVASTLTFGTGLVADVPVTKNWAITSPGFLPAGSWLVHAIYSGSYFYKPSHTANTIVLTIVPASATVTLTSSANPAVRGSAQSITATVKALLPGTVPTGTVTFYDQGIRIGNPIALTAGGTAQLPLQSLNAGNHPITATYNGDGNFRPASETTALHQKIK